jgi:two-component system chemotaxis response regulator CheY
MITILVVEDDEDLRQTMRSVLEFAGYEVMDAVDGLDGLRCLAISNSIGLILTDIDMPRMDGLELIQVLRNDRVVFQKWGHIPIVICSRALQHAQHLTSVVSASFEKPVDFKRLLSTLEKIIQESS